MHGIGRKPLFVRPGVLALLVAGVMALCGGCENRSEPTARPEAAGPESSVIVEPASFSFGNDSSAGVPLVSRGYVDDQLCAECHQAEYEGYQDVGMSKTFSLIGQAPVVEDFEHNHYYHEPSDRHYEMHLRDGKYYQRRYQVDVEGNIINEVEVEVEGFIGSGGHVRTYVYRNGDYELYQLPLAWYEHQHTWLMNPGYDKAKHEGFTRRITRNCMFCHNAYPDAPVGSDEYWEPALFPKELPTGHGCQRCHGPGAEHVEVARNPMATTEQLNSSIINTGRFDPEVQEDTCLVCHLLPSAGFPSRILRNGRSEFSHRPGEKLDEYVFHVDYEDPRHNPDRFEINHHPYRLFQSRCYTESVEQMQCVTCHDPHFKPKPEDRIAYNRANCLKCHGVPECETAMEIETKPAGTDHAEPAMANCIPCHMPKQRAQDVIHATMTDHLIVAHPESEEERIGPLDEFNPPRRTTEPRPYWDEHVPPDANEQLHLAIAGAGAGIPEQVDRLKKLIDEQEPDYLQPYGSLAEALMNAGRYDEAVEELQRILRKFPDHGRAYTEYGLALERVSRPARAIEAYEKSLEIGPPMPETFLGLGTAHYRIGELDESIRYLELALKARPIYPVASLNLGMVYEVKGEYDAAREHLELALAGEPELALGYLHLGQVHWRQGERKDALRVWRQGVVRDETNPRMAEAKAMGMLYAAAFDQALAEADRGFKLGADQATMLLVAAMAQHAKGNYQVAGSAFQASQQAMQQQRPSTFVFTQLWQDAQLIFLRRQPTNQP